LLGRGAGGRSPGYPPPISDNRADSIKFFLCAMEAAGRSHESIHAATMAFYRVSFDFNGCLDLPRSLEPGCWRGKVSRLALLPGSIGRIGLRCQWDCLHRLLKRLLLQSPGVLSARQFVPPFGLGNPFSPVSGLKPRPLQAMLFHSRAMIIAHKLFSLIHNLICSRASESS
jgi:hypothetical protein